MKKINWSELIRNIKDYSTEKILIFGSYADETNNPDSDIDIFVFKRIDDKHRRQEKLRLKQQLRNFMFKYDISVDVHLDHPENIEKRIEMGDLFYKEIIDKGKVLYAK